MLSCCKDGIKKRQSAQYNTIYLICSKFNLFVSKGKVMHLSNSVVQQSWISQTSVYDSKKSRWDTCLQMAQLLVGYFPNTYKSGKEGYQPQVDNPADRTDLQTLQRQTQWVAVTHLIALCLCIHPHNNMKWIQVNIISNQWKHKQLQQMFTILFSRF